MKHFNPLKSLNWKTLFQASYNRRRRHSRCASRNVAAEVLEMRALLAAATVNVVQVGNNLILTADANGSAGSTPEFEIHRIDATTVQVDDNSSGTLIAKNGDFAGAGASQTFTISSVANVTANLGTGYDRFSMFDLNTTGNVFVNGISAGSGGALGSTVKIYSNASDMTIGGAIIENLGLKTGSAASENDINASNGFAFTVNGKIIINDSASSVSWSPDDDIEIFSDSTGGNLLVKGSISVNMTGAGSGDTFFELQAEGGTATFNGPVFVKQSGSADMTFQISTEAGGKLVVNNSVDYSGSGTGSEGVKVVTGDNDGSSSITLNGSIKILQTGTGDHTTEIITEESGGPIAIKGNVVVRDQGTGASIFTIETDVINSPITIGGSVNYDNSDNTKNHDSIRISGSTDEGSTLPIVSIKGALILRLSNDTSTSPDTNDNTANTVYLGEDEGTTGSGYGLVVSGKTNIDGGAGQDTITLAEVKFNRGVVIVTGSNPVGMGDNLQINGSMFGESVIVKMQGPNAEIDINNGGGFQPTVFDDLFVAIMVGSNPQFVVANGTGAGFSPVLFKDNVVVAGRPKGNGLIKYNPANVSGKIITGFFNKVPFVAMAPST